MIQDIEPKRLDNTFVPREPGPGSRLMAFCDGRVFVKEGAALDFLLFEELERWCADVGEGMPGLQYLFSIGETDYFLTGLPEAFVREAGTRYVFIKMFEVRARRPREQVFAAATAWHLYTWYRDNQFCGRCGGKLSHDGAMRMLSCPACGNVIFPKIAPAIIAGVTNGDFILMTKYAGRAYKRYALIAGFTEIGETAEETVRREVMEEAGLRVKNIRYCGSQPWGFDQNLLLGYFCELDGAGDIRLDTQELSEAKWVCYRDIPDDTEGLSLTREMMATFRRSRERRVCSRVIL